MQYEKPNKEYHGRSGDLLFDYFKDNLKDFQLPVNDKCWENISQRIAIKQNNRRLWMLYPVAAIILLLIIFGVKYQLTDSMTFRRLEAVENDNFIFAKLKNDFIRNRRDYSYPLHSRANSGLEKNKFEQNTGEEVASKEVKNSDSVAVLSDFPVPGSPDKSDVRTASSEQKAFLLENPDDEVLFAEIPRKRKSQWGLAAAWGVSGSSSGSMDELIYASAMGSGPVLLTPDDFSGMEYAPPFSVGFSVRKQINNIFSLETGLMYSYLSTDCKNKYDNSHAASLKLHYLGVPLNAVVNIWGMNSQFKIYASGGVAVEKGIQYKLSQVTSEIGQMDESRGGIDGIQWSLNGSLGMSYMLHDHWNIYLEPRLSYYFNNNQPISIRTEKQTIFSLNSGIRYEF